MFIDRDNLHTSLFGLVGFHNADDPEYPTLAPSLLGSRSNYYVNDVHSLLSIENIDQSIKNFSQYNYPAYAAGTEYSVGEKVAESGSSYEYINATPSTGNTPPNATYWRLIDELSDYLIKAVYRGIDNLLDDYVNEKKLRTKIKSVFTDILLFNGNANYRDFEPNADKFVGLRIRMKKGERHLVTILNKIGHQFDQIIGSGDTLTMYLYHSSQQEEIASWPITHATAKNAQWTSVTVDNLLRYVSDDYDAGGDFYIGYNQSELEALPNSPQALNKNVYWQEAPCDCAARWSDYWQQYTQYIDVIGFEVLETEMPGGVLFDPLSITLYQTKTYGINLNLTTKCDIAEFILQEDEILAQALNYSVGKILLEAIAYSTRKGNSLTNQIRGEAKKELFKHEGAWGTVHDRARAAMKGMSFDFSGMENSCMPQDSEFVIDVEMTSV